MHNRARIRDCDLTSAFIGLRSAGPTPPIESSLEVMCNEKASEDDIRTLVEDKDSAGGDPNLVANRTVALEEMSPRLKKGSSAL
jgi:hypothetical protein